MLLTLDILQHLCGVHHAAFCCTDSRRLISLMLFGCQIELAYSRTSVTTKALPFTKEEPIFRVLPKTQGPACFVGDVDVSPWWRLRSV